MLLTRDGATTQGSTGRICVARVNLAEAENVTTDKIDANLLETSRRLEHLTLLLSSVQWIPSPSLLYSIGCLKEHHRQPSACTQHPYLGRAYLEVIREKRMNTFDHQSSRCPGSGLSRYFGHIIGCLRASEIAGRGVSKAREMFPSAGQEEGRHIHESNVT